MAYKNNQHSMTPAQFEGEFEQDLGDYISFFLSNIWLITIISGIMVACGLFYILITPNIYRAESVIQIEQDTKGIKPNDDLAELMGISAPRSSDTEIEVIKSRTVIGSVVDKLNLTIYAQPYSVPVITEIFKNHRDNSIGTIADFVVPKKVSRGTEQIDVYRFDVDRSYLGIPFTVRYSGNDRYELLLGDSVLGVGDVGKLLELEQGAIRLYVARIDASEGSAFVLVKGERIKTIDQLRKDLVVVEKGQNTGVLLLAYEGKNSALIKSVIQEVGEAYLRQNVERKSEESESMLGFIDHQLPLLKAKLDAAESAFRSYQEIKGSVDISYESQTLINRLTEIERKLSAIGLERSELETKFTPKHPALTVLAEKEAKIEKEKSEIEKTIQSLPSTELESVRLKRDTDVASELYMLLLNRAQELKVSKSGTIGDVRILDPAVVIYEPVAPNKILVLFVSLLAGVFAGISWALIRQLLNKNIEDPSIIESQLGYAIYVEIPFSNLQASNDSRKSTKTETHSSFLLAESDSTDLVVESLRSFRTSLQFALIEAENNIISISGPSPNIGKSFVSANFAYILAASGKKVLLIDADLRKGHVGRAFGLENTNGFSEILSNSSAFEDAVHKNVCHQDLDVLTCGVYPPNPAELLMSERLEKLFQHVKSQYDIILVDTPPILAVTDAAIIGRFSGTNFMVLKAGTHTLKEIAMATKRFIQNGVKIRGFIYNGVQIKRKYGYGYRYQGYSYEYK